MVKETLNKVDSKDNAPQHVGEINCCICLNEILGSETITACDTCNTILHDACIIELIETTNNYRLCPHCRGNLPSKFSDNIAARADRESMVEFSTGDPDEMMDVVTFLQSSYRNTRRRRTLFSVRSMDSNDNISDTILNREMIGNLGVTINEFRNGFGTSLNDYNYSTRLASTVGISSSVTILDNLRYSTNIILGITTSNAFEDVSTRLTTRRFGITSIGVSGFNPFLL